MRTIPFIVCCIAVCTEIHSQDKAVSGDFVTLVCDPCAVLKATRDGQLEYIIDGKVTLVSREEGGDIYLEAAYFEFFDSESGELLASRVVLTGNVIVIHPAGKVTCGKAVFDFEAGTILFTKNLVLYNERSPEGGTATRYEMDLETGSQIFTDLEISISLESPEDAAKAFHLTVEDILDWPAFFERLKVEDASESKSPGRHFLSLLQPQVHSALTTKSIDGLMEIKIAILGQLNDLLELQEFYDADSWGGATPTDEVAALLEADPASLSLVERVWINRAMLHLAYPELIDVPPALPE